MKGISAPPGVQILYSQLSEVLLSRGVSFLRVFKPCSAHALAFAGSGVFFERRLGRTGIGSMVVSQAETLRKAIENLIDAKLHDAISRPGGLERLTAHRMSGVASFDIRNAERKLQQTLSEVLSGETAGA